MDAAPQVDAVILGCVSGKRPGSAKAKDLYDSHLFFRRRRYAESTGKPWFIFSAKHGILDPDQQIEWYDVALSKQPMEYRRRIGRQAAEQLEALVGSLNGRRFEIHAGASYVGALRPEITRRGGTLINPVEGLQIGHLLHWYDVQAGAGTRTRAPLAPASGAAKLAVPTSPPREAAQQLPADAPRVELTLHRITRGPSLHFEDAARFANDFLRMDASAQPGGYDDLANAGSKPSDRITTADIVAINTTMRARSPHSAWHAFISVDEPLDWLAALDPSWDLVELDDPEWRGNARDGVERALVAATGPGRGLSVGTKVLHLKRPRMFPVLDSLVLQQLGVTDRVRPIAVLDHLRAEGRRSIHSLRAVQTALRATHPRSLVRIIDILLWASHPAAGLNPSLADWQHVIRHSEVDDG